MAIHVTRSVSAALVLGASAAGVVATGAPSSAATPKVSARTALMTPAQLIAASKAATLSATSVTIREHVVSNGTSFSVFIQGRYPNRVQGIVNAAGYVLRVAASPTHEFINANAVELESLFKLTAPQATSLAGRWLVTPIASSADRAALAKFNPKAVEVALFASLSKDTAKLRESTGILNGKPIFVLRPTTGPGSVDFAATGKPYFVRFVATGVHAAGKGTPISEDVTLSGFGTSTSFALPSGAENLATAIDAVTATTTTTTTTTPPA